MAKFGIYSVAGVKKAEGYPTFTGTYMKAGVLDFREIASPTPIDWAIGDYVGYEQNGSVVPAYSRTGFKYVLYNVPQVKRQASNGTYGGAFVYQNVQFHDASYDFEICPFRDLVVGDNRVHFSTQPAISVFDDVAGIAERIQACLDDMFPSKWNVQVASGTDYDTLMAEEREFSVSGVNIRGVLDKIYEVWPEVGWIFSVNNGTCTLTIGGAWMNTPDTYVYGKGNGLTGISRTPANVDELANRIYVFGSNRNMLPRWYNNQDIKDADSVDIQHLMLPVNAIPALDYAGWGKTDVSGVDKPDPAKAFIQDDASIAARGLRPKTVYFDGSGDYKEIYPSVEKTTIQDLLDVMESGAEYRPDTSKYPDTSVRVDKVLSVNSTFDSGLAASNGRETVQSEYFNVNASRTHSVTSQQKFSMLLDGGIFTPSETGSMALKFVYELSGTITLTGIKSAYLNVEVRRGASGPIMMNKRVDLEKDESTPNTFIIGNASFTVDKANVTSSDIYLTATIVVEPDSTSVGQTATLSATGTLSFSMERYREKTFNITLRQLGFDISAQAKLGEGKTIAMRSGDCVGRSFRISSTSYNSSTDTWNLEVIRSNDESLSQWFPNSTYQVRAGDEFVLLDIAMPATYVSVAEKRLLLTARELLADTAKELWQYNPEIDAKFMANSARSIMPGDIIAIADSDIVDGDGNLNVDSVTINEGESNIPTYKVTIRDKKKKSYSDKASVLESNSTPVTTPSQTVVHGVSTNSDSFFEEDGNGGIKLKDEYIGFWTNGFLAAGGIGSGSGGGGNIDLDRVWESLTNNTDKPNVKINAHHIPIGSGLAIDSQTGNIVVTAVGGVTAVAGLTGNIAADDLLHALGLDSDLATISVGLQSLQSQIDSVATRTSFDELIVSSLFVDQLAADVITANGLTVINTINGTVANANKLGNQSPSYYATKSSVDTIAGYFTDGAAKNALKLGGELPAYYATKTSVDSLDTRIKVFEDLFGIDNSGNVYIKQYDDNGTTKSRGFWNYSFITAGGVGSGGGGGGGDIDLDRVWESLTNNTDYPDVTINVAHIPTISYTKVSGLGAAATYGIGSVASDNTGLVTGGMVWSAIDALPEPMVFKGSLGTGGTITSLPSASSANEGFTYKVITDGTYAGQAAKIGDLFISNGTSWIWIPSGDEPSGTVTSVGLTLPTGLSVTGSPITSSGTFAVSFTTGYSIPLTADTEKGVTAYNSLDTISLALQSLQSQLDSVASRNAWDEVVATTVYADIVSSSTLYGELIGNAATATKLATARTIWGQSFDGTAIVSGNMSSVGNISMNGSISGATSITASGLIKTTNYVQATRFYLSDSVYFVLDANGVKLEGAGFYTDSFVSAGGFGSGGGGGSVDLDRVWESLTNNTDKPNVLINVAHIPAIQDISGFSTKVYDASTSRTANTVLAAPNGSDGVASFRTLISADIPTLAISKVDGLQSALNGKQAAYNFIITGAGGSTYNLANFVTSSGVTSVATGTGLTGGTITGTGTISIDSTYLGYISDGETAYGWGNHANVGYLLSSTAASTYQTIISDLNTIRSNASNGNTAYNGLSTISDALQSLQSQIDSVATKHCFDELIASYIASDIVSADAFYGALNGNATTASYLVGTSYNVGSATVPVYFSGGLPVACTASSLFGLLSSSAGTNLSITIAGQNRTATLYATYNSAGENISDKFGIISNSLQSLQSQIDSVAAKISSDEVYAGCGYFDMLSIGSAIGGDLSIIGKLSSTGTIHSSTGIYSEGYVTAGAAASSSDERLKDNITEIDEGRAISLLMALSGREWEWNDKNDYLSGKHGSGLIAQEVEKVMPWATEKIDDGYYLNYAAFWGVAIPVMQSHEQRIEALERENKELKRKIEILTNNS